MSNKQCITGPYRATKLWNDAVRSFYNGMPVSRHWKGLRQYDRCFTATEAIDWLLNHLQSNPNFGDSVSRDQTAKLLRKFLKAGLIEDVRGNTTRPDDFKDSRELYKFSNRSPLKALRTPRTPGRPVLGTLQNNASNHMENQDGASPFLRKRFQGSIRKSTKGTENLDDRPCNGSIRTKNGPKRAGSIHSGENAVNEIKDRGGMQECHLVAKQLSKAETNDVWKHVLFGKLDTVCERLLFGDTASILDPSLVEGEWIHHNMTKLTSRGVVQVPEAHPDDLPNWILTAMKCMAHWPNVVDTTCNIPNYPGVEKDVFKIVRDFFTNLVTPLIPYELYESFIRIYIGAEFLDITYRSPNSAGGVSSSGKSCDGSYNAEDFNDNDSVEDLMLNMSISGQQKTSTPNTDNENNTSGEKQGLEGHRTFRREGSSRSLGSNLHTPSGRQTALLNSSNLQSLKLRRLKNYTDFKEDNLYPTLLEGSHEGSGIGIPSPNHESIRPLSRQSKISSEPSMHRQPETVRSVKTNDYARRVRKENDGKEESCELAGAIRSSELSSFDLPQNCCFETAFTSDSPRTRIIPQKSVDSLHFKNGERLKVLLKQRPKSIAVPSCSSCDRQVSTTNFWDTTKELKNVSRVSDLFKSSIMSTNTSGEYVTALMHSPLNRSRSAGNLEILNEDKITQNSSDSVSVHNLNEINPTRSLASRIRDSIKRKHSRDDSFSRKRSNVSRESKDLSAESGKFKNLDHLRTKSGGYMNPTLSPDNTSHEDIRSIKSYASDYQELDSGLSHLRTKSGGFLNLALMPSNNSIDTVDSANTFSGASTTCYHTAVQHQRSVSPLYGRKSHEHFIPSRTEVLRNRHNTPDGCLSHSLSSSSGCSVYHSALSQTSRNSTPNPTSPPVPPRVARPVSGMGGIYSKSQSQECPKIPNYENVADLSKQLSSSANELSDRWADRTPYGQVPPYAQGGVWRHYHSSPRLLTREGKDIAISSVRLLLLLLAPVRRRKLHLLLRMMSKMSTNDKLTLDQEQSTRALVLNTFTRSILLCDQEVDYDEVLSLRIVSFLMDNHEEVLRPPQDLSVLVHRKLSQIQRSKIVYGSTIEDRGMTLTYCRQVSKAEYERQCLTGSQQFLAQLLDQIIDNDKISAKSKKKKLKDFKSLYPDVYKAKFPEEDHKPETRSKVRSLIKLASFSSLGKGRSLRM
ncbi:DEP domain-containing protein 1A isoform X3 [Procambarus clarkii]|uniref:DEP domain-containing protein 1A isoform X3 n=1 Tax=Procambarus clarkii TaxID=6728 RepID=UPI001E6731CE|nr:DEP domain-containing protein 1A-like isoform X3 [Procambarus clarkii]